MDSISWLQLSIVCFLGAMSPGPSLAVVISNTLSGGRVYGVFTSIGHAFGIGWWAILTVVGVAEVMVISPVVILTIQLAGACLIGYIGWRTLLSRNSLIVQEGSSSFRNFRSLLKGTSEGFMVALLNPKVALFFLAIFSHYVSENLDWYDAGLIAGTVTIIDGFWYIVVALILTGASSGSFMNKWESTVKSVSGAILIGVALYLLTVTLVRL